MRLSFPLREICRLILRNKSGHKNATKDLEGTPYCSHRGGILDFWLQPNAAVVTTRLIGFSCGQSTLVDIGRLRKGDFYNC
mmetsp:Transcript_7456/g.18148  ORF Transcript_7456/g.18148 Transcript_7456/m.18148 type:complete len:81 (-) Transcript_7456:35-277(-)